MSALTCFLWWLVLGAFLGWLASWLLGKCFRRPAPQPVERVIEKPVDRVIEKFVDNPAHLARINSLESEVALITGLRSQINQLQAAPPKVVEKLVDRPVEKIVEKIIDRPVEKIVEKVVEKPVDRMVEKLIDNPAHLARIRALESEVALIAGLRSKINQLQAAPPKVVEKLVDRPVEKIVEKIIDRPVERIVEKIIDRPVEKIVEKVVEKPVDRVVEKRVDNPAHLTRIQSLESDLGLMAGLRNQISQLQALPPKVVEKIVEKPVDRIVEKIVERIVDRPIEKIVERIIDRPVEKIVERMVDRPIEKIVEKVVDRPVEVIIEKIIDRPVDRMVEKLVDNPAHLLRIQALEGEVALMAGLRSEISQLQARPPQVVEKIVEKPVDRIVEKLIERPVEKIIEKIVDRPFERIVEIVVDRPVEKIVEKPVERVVENVAQKNVAQDTAGIEQRDRQLRELEARIDALRRGPAIDIKAAKAAGFALKNEDDLEIVEGIGPKIAVLLRAEGITTFMQLAETTPERIREILDQAGPRYRIANPGTWPEQAELAARNRWAALKSLQTTLEAGVRVDGAQAARIQDLQTQLAARQAEIQRLQRPLPIDRAIAKAAGFNLKARNGRDDLEVIEGIGPKIAQLFHAEGVSTFAALAKMTPAQIQPMLDKAGAKFRLANPETWPEQAELAARNQWRALRALQGELTAGNR